MIKADKIGRFCTLAMGTQDTQKLFTIGEIHIWMPVDNLFFELIVACQTLTMLSSRTNCLCSVIYTCIWTLLTWCNWSY